MYSPFILNRFSPQSHQSTFPSAGQLQSGLRRAQYTWPRPGSTQPPPVTCPEAGSESQVLLRLGRGRTGQQARRATPKEAAHGSGAGVLPALSPAAPAQVPLTSWVWRAAAARRGRGEAAGFWPGWDMARPRGTLPRGGRSGDWKGGPGGERWERGREGVEGLAGAPREAAFPTQPRTRSGVTPLGPPLPARRWLRPGCSGPGLPACNLTPSAPNLLPVMPPPPP